MPDTHPLSGGLPIDADLMLPEAPPPPFDWLREGTSYWLYEENGAFGIPRNGVEAEPHSWEQRRYQANFAFADGRLLLDSGLGAMPPVLDQAGRPAVLGGGPITYRCIEPWQRWLVSYDGMAIDTTIGDQIAGTIDESRRVPLRYQVEVTMAVPANVQDISPERFTTWGKGKRRDACSIGLGWRFEQMLRGDGELAVDGATRSFRCTGSRIKRRSVRTDGLFLRGHAWQAVLFPDGSAAGYEARPVHDDGHEPWNEGFVYKDGVMHPARAVKVPWLGDPHEKDEDVAFELESALGVTRIEGRTTLTTLRLARGDLWGLDLHQGGARYGWNGQSAYGMIERSTARG